MARCNVVLLWTVHIGMATDVLKEGEHRTSLPRISSCKELCVKNRNNDDDGSGLEWQRKL